MVVSLSLARLTSRAARPRPAFGLITNRTVFFSRVPGAVVAISAAVVRASPREERVTATNSNKQPKKKDRASEAMQNNDNRTDNNKLAQVVRRVKYTAFVLFVPIRSRIHHHRRRHHHHTVGSICGPRGRRNDHRAPPFHIEKDF